MAMMPLKLKQQLNRAYQLNLQAQDRWSEDQQINQANSECAEFIVASTHLAANRGNKVDLLEEAADVLIMGLQMLMRLSEESGPYKAADTLERKLDKLECHLRN